MNRVAVAHGRLRNYVNFVCYKRFRIHIFEAYDLWFMASKSSRNKPSRVILVESLELLETMVPGPGFRRGAAENGRRFAAINSVNRRTVDIAQAQ